jgi:hypothetical protein
MLDQLCVQLIMIAFGWALGLVTALVNQRYSHNLEMERLLTEMKLQREQEMLKRASDWNQEQALAKLGGIVVRGKYPQLAPMLEPLPKATLQVEYSDGKTQTTEVRGRGALIGAHSNCDVQITSDRVADFLARIIIADKIFVLEEIAPDPPVLLNGNVLLFSSILHDKDLIQIGTTTLKFNHAQH